MDRKRENSPAKTKILVMLKKMNEVSLEDLSMGMNISKVAALKHLGKLENEELIQRRYVPFGRGRPKCLFSLTEKGQSVLPRSYSDIAVEAIKYIESSFGREHVGNLLMQRTEKKVPSYREALKKLEPRDSIRSLSELRDTEGYMSEWKQLDDDTFELIEFNCPILGISDKFPEACMAENQLFSKSLDADVESTHRVVDGSKACRFLIRYPKKY